MAALGYLALLFLATGAHSHLDSENDLTRGPSPGRMTRKHGGFLDGSLIVEPSADQETRSEKPAMSKEYVKAEASLKAALVQLESQEYEHRYAFKASSQKSLSAGSRASNVATNAQLLLTPPDAETAKFAEMVGRLYNGAEDVKNGKGKPGTSLTQDGQTEEDAQLRIMAASLAETGEEEEAATEEQIRSRAESIILYALSKSSPEVQKMVDDGMLNQ